MIVEKYVSNPAANSFDYQVADIRKPMRCKFYFVHSNTAVFAGWVFIYKGNINAYNIANDQYAVFLRQYSTTASSMVNGAERVDVELPAGTYTFATYTTPDTTGLRWCFFLV